MLNQVAVEALYSATYVENYMDYVENLPDAVQRHLSRIRDIDVQYRRYLKDAEYLYDLWVKLLSSTTEADIQKRNKIMAKIQKTYINAQELGDEKMQTVSQLQDLIDQKSRQVDLDFKNLDYGKEDQISDVNITSTNSGNTIVTGQIGAGSSGLSGTQVTGATKNTRPQSPSIQSGIQTAIKIENNQQNYTTSAQLSNQTTTQRVSTPTITERSSNNNQNTNNNITERTTNKRSRRPRNENIVNMDLGGNESNSANEGSTQHQTKSSNSISNNGGGGGATTAAGTSTAGQKKSANNQGGGAKKKKRKTRGQGANQNNARDTRDDTPPPDPIDPDEPTYCLCDQISFGEMILCDNDLCPIEWFHFSCVALMSKPKGKWFCPNCRGDRPNVMKPKAQFLKELERYNKEKEEKT